MVEIAKKSSISNKAKSLFDSYKERLWGLIAEFIEEEIGRMGKWVANIAHFKQKIKREVFFHALINSKARNTGKKRKERC